MPVATCWPSGDARAVLIVGETSTYKAYTALQLNNPTAELVDAV
jgi:hypothetical protein